ncbi:uncharacterized protein A1O9_00361 [Exophiala aquamarina CBS 119918]|uniref:Transcription factor domain-containing protein n=1 Tax=Exophiala aquamarina CBS 119918 TaxID=1182545 RepID=A0A072PQL3_9EURO|nr:uncharacterized protein A1O9_00361 [Exophiala aquamarina CBS 119918]KEF62389.1 hypothetical protein A1O9_00361 [Exophiala aquamarina CBS 119918]
MTETVKTQIKKRADTRRERQTAQVTTVETGDRNFIFESGQAFMQKARVEDSDQPTKITGSPQTSNLGAIQNVNPISSTELDRMQWMGSVLGFLDDYEEFHDHLPLLSHGRDFEIDFLMKYMDYVFPHLFPFYQPGIHETGRSWILALLRRSRVAFHSAMSLSAYFFIFTLIDGYPGQHELCKSQLWAAVERQADMCFDMIQHDIQDLSLRTSQSTLLEKARVMESITQFLIFEVALQRDANWNLHLTPALALFEEIWRSIVAEGPESKLLSILDGMTQHLRFGLDDGGYVWSPEQAGFRFVTGLLILIDIVASVSLEQQPRLAKYHPHILADIDHGEPDFGTIPLHLSTHFGCQNWVLLSISRTIVLEAWKKDMKKAARLSMIELVNRASSISRLLNDGFARLDNYTSTCQKDNTLSFQSYLNGRLSRSSTSSAIPTKVWALASQIYLAVVVSGWQPSNAEIRSNVSQMLELLWNLDRSTHLRALAWPLCVAGCMSAPGAQEQEFRRLLKDMDELSMVGALSEAQKIMVKVWESRESLDPDTWDLAACFRILGTPVLLF